MKRRKHTHKKVRTTKTVGVSPKTPAAALAAILTPTLVGLISKHLGIDVGSEDVNHLLLGVIGIAAGGFAGWKAPPGTVVHR